MSSIENIKLEINEISDKLKNISTEIENLNTNNREANNKLNFDNIKLQAKAYPIKGHPIEKTDEYFQKLYFAMLISIVQIDKDSIEEKLKFIQRIIYGGNLKLDILELERQSLQIDDNFIDEFIKLLRKNDLSINFAVDVILIANISEKYDDKLAEYVTSLFYIIRFYSDQIKFIIKMSKAIVLQDESLYEDILIDPIIKIDLLKFKMYTPNISKDRYKFYIVENSQDKIVIKSKNPVVYECNLKQLLNNKKDIILENLIINLNCATKLELKSISDLTFKNCKFVGDGSDKCLMLSIEGANSVNIKNCEFNNITTAKQRDTSEKENLIYIQNIKKINIVNNKMIRCSVKKMNTTFFDLTYGYGIPGYERKIAYIIHVIDSEAQLVNVKNNKFIQCEGKESNI